MAWLFFEIYISQTNTYKIILYVALGVKKTFKTQVQSPGHGDPLDEGMTTHSSILAWRNPWKKEPGRQWSIGSQRVDHDWSNLAHKHITNKIMLSSFLSSNYSKLTIPFISCSHIPEIFNNHNDLQIFIPWRNFYIYTLIGVLYFLILNAWIQNTHFISAMWIESFASLLSKAHNSLPGPHIVILFWIWTSPQKNSLVKLLQMSNMLLRILSSLSCCYSLTSSLPTLPVSLQSTEAHDIPPASVVSQP